MNQTEASETPAIVHEVLRSPGQPLDSATRAFMESRFGHDFSKVRVHTDAAAAESARAVDASAFTAARHVVFGARQYRPQALKGKRLLAHELVHVVQQHETAGAMPLALPSKVTHPDEPAERQADSVSRSLVSGGRPSFGQKPSTSRVLGSVINTPVSVVARQAEPPGRSERLVRVSVTPKERPKLKRREPRTEVDRLKIREDCWNYLDLVKGRLAGVRGAWSSAARTLGSAYAFAYDTHKTAVLEAEKEAALKYELAFAVLSIVSAGALGWVGEAAQAGRLGEKAKNVMVAGLEDAVQEGVGQAIGIIKTAVAPTNATVSQLPQVFQNDLENILDLQWDKVERYFTMLKQELWDRRLEAFDGVDLAELRGALDRWMQGNRFMNEPKQHDQKELADELERGIWAKWAQGLHRVVRRTYGGKGGVIIRDEPVFTAPGTPVEARLNTLGITKAAGIGEDFGWWTSDAEVLKLVVWAKTFEPKRFEF